ncbi:MAG: PDZ domain-containing protein [Bacteroidales bacterium]|nr:PDZ domain-containing protein [Bacteroidales bacterium]
MRNRRDRLIIFIPLIVSMALIIGILLGNWITGIRIRGIVSDEISNQRFSIRPGSNLGSGFSLTPKGNKISSALQYILNEYVDTVSLNNLNESVMPALVDNLDPHSIYIPASDFQRFSEPLMGNFSGIGVSFNMTDDTVAIINTIPNGPSEMVGIMAGDRIIMVDDSVVAGVNMPSDDIVKMLKGPKNTVVKVTVHRRGEKAPLDFEITRDDIPIYSVDVAYKVNENTGYIKISQFAQTTYHEFMQAIERLKSQGVEKLIIDLRRNGGGIMEAATMIADQFLEEGQLIVYTEGRTRPRENDYATSRGILKNDKVVVLMDESSASASEILAGAIQDNDRGLVIGRRSFGKGLVQEEMRFADGSALRLTVARYYTPTGRSIQRSYENGKEDYYHDFSERWTRGELEHEDSIKFDDSQKFVTPGGKIVYGGGGIMPDVFVPVDTSGASEYYNRVRSLGLMYRFAFFYTDIHRASLDQFTTAEDIEGYLDDQDLLPQFINYAGEKGVQPDYDDIRTSRLVLQKTIKAYVARNIIDNDGFYPIIADIDQTLRVAIDTIATL